MARRRLTRKEMNQPDQFISRTVQILDWGKSHTQRLLYATIGIVVLIGLLVAWFAWQKQRHRQADVLLYQAVKLLNADSASAAGQSDATANRDQAQQQLLVITRDYNGSRAAALAHWHLGHLYFARADYVAALASYERARQNLSRHRQQLIPALVILDTAYAQEAMGDCPQALARFEEVLQSPPGWLHGEAFLGMGRCYEQTGALDKARAIYERALSDADVSDAMRQSIEDRQTRLQATGSISHPAAQPAAPSQKPTEQQ